MKTNPSKLAALLSLFVFSASAYAVPTLQVGAPAGASDVGTYADYLGSTSNPSETDTAITSGGTLFVAGVYNRQDNLLLGGKYAGGVYQGNTYEAGLDWGAMGFASAFNGHGAVLMATAYGTGSLSVNGLGSFYSTPTFENGFVMPNPPSNHDPVKENPNTSYYFFEIGNFANNANAVVDFASETGSANGEIKTVSIAASGFGWIHFDVLALGTGTTNAAGQEVCIATNTQGKCTQYQTITYLVNTGLEGNPGSHDATWKNPGDVPPSEIPEPTTPLLLGLGLIGLFMARRMHSNQI